MFVSQTVGNTNYLCEFCTSPPTMATHQITTDTFYTSVGERVRQKRKTAGMDQETLARHLNLSRTTVINIEKGRQRLSLEHAWLVAQVLSISIVELLPASKAKTDIDWAKKIEQNNQIGDNEKESVMELITKLRTKR